MSLIEKFDRVAKAIEANVYGWKDRVAIYKELDELQSELLPTIEMTQEQHRILLDFLENSNLSSALSYFIEKDLMGDLSHEDIAIAWLYPKETIKVIDMEN